MLCDSGVSSHVSEGSGKLHHLVTKSRIQAFFNWEERIFCWKKLMRYIHKLTEGEQKYE